MEKEINKYKLSINNYKESLANNYYDKIYCFIIKECLNNKFSDINLLNIFLHKINFRNYCLSNINEISKYNCKYLAHYLFDDFQKTFIENNININNKVKA